MHFAFLQILLQCFCFKHIISRFTSQFSYSRDVKGSYFLKPVSKLLLSRISFHLLWWADAGWMSGIHQSRSITPLQLDNSFSQRLYLLFPLIKTLSHQSNTPAVSITVLTPNFLMPFTNFDLSKDNLLMTLAFSPT